jgi:hypothetical protein
VGNSKALEVYMRIHKNERTQNLIFDFQKQLQKSGSFLHELEISKKFIAENFDPGEVFDEDTLGQWASEHGYTWSKDTGRNTADEDTDD